MEAGFCASLEATTAAFFLLLLSRGGGHFSEAMNKVQDILQGNGTADAADNDRRMSRVSTGPMGKNTSLFFPFLVLIFFVRVCSYVRTLEKQHLFEAKAFWIWTFGLDVVLVIGDMALS